MIAVCVFAFFSFQSDVCCFFVVVFIGGCSLVIVAYSIVHLFMCYVCSCYMYMCLCVCPTICFILFFYVIFSRDDQKQARQIPCVVSTTKNDIIQDLYVCLLLYNFILMFCSKFLQAAQLQSILCNLFVECV